MATSAYSSFTEKDSSHFDSNLPKTWKNGLDMDASMLFKLLSEGDSAICTEILLALRQSLRQNEAKTLLRGPDCFVFFDVLAQILGDPRSEVCFECLQLIGTVIPLIGDELDRCLLHIMPQVLGVLGRDSLELREATVQVLHMYMRYTNNWHHFMRSFAQNGLNNSDLLIKKGCLTSIDLIFNEEFANENLLLLVEALVRLLVSGDNRTLYTTLMAVQNLARRLGPVIFDFYLKRLDESLRLLYLQILQKASIQETSVAFQHSDTCLNGYATNGNMGYLQNSHLQQPVLNYGLFESSALAKLKQNEWRARVEGVEYLKRVLRDTNDLTPLVPNLDRFFTLLSRLLGDTCFKVVILTLNVYEIIISRLKHKLTRHIKSVVSALAKHLGDLRVVVKEHNIKVLHKLMCETHPKVILDILLEHRSNRNPRMREEVVNRVTAALLTFPSYNFDLLSLCDAVTPALVDSKRRVRLAALECVSVLAQTMGSSRMTPLLSSVDQVEMNSEGEGLASAVHARLSRKILPRCTVDGMVIYAISIPNSANVQSRSPYSAGADISWIMAAHGTTGSLTPPSVRAQAPELPELTKQPRAMNPNYNHRKPEEEIVKASKLNLPLEEAENDDTTPPTTTTDQRYEPEMAKDQDEGFPVQSIQQYIGDKIDQTEELLELLSTTAADPAEKPRSGRVNDPIHTAPERLLNKTWPSGSAQSSASGDVPIPTRPVLAGRNSASSSVGRMRRGSRLSRSVPGTAMGQRDISTLPPVTPPPASATSKKKGFVDALDSGSPKPSSAQQRLTQRSNSVDFGNLCVGLSEVQSLFGGRPLLGNASGLVGSQKRSQSARETTDQDDTPPGTLEGNLRLPALEAAVDPSLGSRSPPLPDAEVIPLTPTPMSPVETPQEQADQWEYEDDFESASSSSITSSSTSLSDNSIACETGEEEEEREEEEEIQAETKENDEVEESHTADPETGEGHVEELTKEEEAVAAPVKQGSSGVEIPTRKSSVTPFPGSLRKSCSTNAVDQLRDMEDASLHHLGVSSSLRSKAMSSKIRPPGFQKIPLPVKSSSSLGIVTSIQDSTVSLNSVGDDTAPEVLEESLRPVQGSPTEALRNAFRDMQSEEWNLKMEGMKTIRVLCAFNTSVVLHSLQTVLNALLQEVRNLRSTVSRYAITTVGYLATKVKRNLDPELENVVTALLRKSGENSGFIRQDVERALGQVVESTTLQKMALALLAGGSRHRNEYVRKTCAQFLWVVVEHLGPSRCLTTKELAEKLFPATAHFTTDKNPLTRYYGRKIFHELILHPDFVRMLHRYLQPNVIKGINSILEAIKRKGPGEGPKEGVRQMGSMTQLQPSTSAAPGSMRKLQRARESSRSKF